ncbi:MAG: hypothetical protein R3F49_24900 [Planctomycetota bacterium]
MSHAPIEHAGERYLTLEVVAELYEVQVVLLHTLYERGAFGPGLTHRGARCIATVRLDRIATVARLHRVCGLDVDAIVVALERFPVELPAELPAEPT